MLEIAKWVGLLCPAHQVEFLYHPSENLNPGDLKHCKAVPLSRPVRDPLRDLSAGSAANASPSVLLWGPEPLSGFSALPEDSNGSSKPFSTRLAFFAGSGKGEAPLTLIHADPRPTEPTIDPVPPDPTGGIFTGSIKADHDPQPSMWPIHSRGAEITANFVRGILEGRSPSPRAFLYPVIAMVEPTRRCNLACPMCPVGSGRTGKTEDMPFEGFQKVIDELAPFLIHLTLHNYGESFLHREIYSMIRYAKDRGIPDVHVSTNGHFLDPSRLVDSGLDQIMISLDGITQEVYARYRVRGRLDRVIKNIRSLSREKKRRRTGRPLMELQFIIMRHNQDQIEGFRKLAAELGADRIRLKTFNLQMSGPEGHDRGLEFLPTRREYTRYEDTHGLILKKTLEENRCKWPWERVVIDSDGRVVPCCNDFKAAYSMGNVFHQSFEEIWFGRKYNRFRKNILRRWRRIPLCASCPVPSRKDLSFEIVELTEK